MNQHSEAENQQFTAEFTAITQAFVALMAEQMKASDPQVQDTVRAHYEFICRFWTPGRTAYKSLALSYVLPTPYRDTYEAAAEGLGQFIHDAVSYWADQNLTD